jgi:hypothetical protein
VVVEKGHLRTTARKYSDFFCVRSYGVGCS